MSAHPTKTVASGSTDVPARQRFSHLRSILEVPVADDTYWPKIPQLETDGIMLDLEDSIASDMKDVARDKVVAICARADILGAKTVFVRVNNLSTSWGESDLRRLRDCPPHVLVCYPKAESAQEVRRAIELAGETACRRSFYVMIESYRGVKAVDEILAVDGVVGVHFGYTDYAMDVNCQPFTPDGDGLFNPSMTVASATIAAAAAAHGVFATGGSLIPNFRDLDKVARFVTSWRNQGYTACIALSPRHLPAVHANIRTSETEMRRARDVLARATDIPPPPFIERKLAELAMKQYLGH